MTFLCCFVIGLLLLTLAHAQLTNTDTRCGQQIVQACGKVTKFFGVDGTQRWRNGLAASPSKGCDGNTNATDSLPYANVSCTAAFMVGNKVASLIGWASLDDWCLNSQCLDSELYPLGERPVAVCHDMDFNPANCCIEPGQHSPTKFRSIVKCNPLVSSTSTSTSSTTNSTTTTTGSSLQPPEMTSNEPPTGTLQTRTEQTLNITPAPSMSPSPFLVPVIVGSLLGAAALVAVLIVLWIRKKRREGPFDQREASNEHARSSMSTYDNAYSSVSTQRTYQDTSDVRAPAF